MNITSNTFVSRPLGQVNNERAIGATLLHCQRERPLQNGYEELCISWSVAPELENIKCYDCCDYFIDFVAITCFTFTAPTCRGASESDNPKWVYYKVPMEWKIQGDLRILTNQGFSNV